jgi:Tfp pilus assembly protein PilW
MVSLALASVLLTAVFSSYIFILRSHSAIESYAKLNAEARTFLGYLGRDLRAAKAVANFTATNLIITVPTNISGGTATVSYTYVPANGTVIRTEDGVSTTLLHNIETYTFSYFNRISAATTVLAELKQVRVNFTLVEFVSSVRLSQQVISAQYVLRAADVSS